MRLVDTLWFTVKPGAAAHVIPSPSDAAVVVGGSYQQSGTVVDRGGNNLNVSPGLAFSTSDPTVTVSAAGQVTGVAYGRAAIKVSYGTLTETAMVSVVPTGRLATVPPPLGLLDASVAVVGTDGSGFKRYPTPQDASAAVWSADATRIYYVGTTRGGPITQRIYSLAVADGAIGPLIADTVTVLSGQSLASPAVSHDGAWIYFITQLPFYGPPSGDIWRVHPDGTALERLVTGQVFRQSPSPSLDGTRLAYVEGDAATANVIKILDLQSGSTLTIPAPNAAEIRWSPTADRIAINGGSGALYVVNADGSQLTQLVPPSSYFTGLGWSPDGRWILAAPGGVPTIIEPTSTGLQLPLSFRGVGVSWSPR
jgi:Tol biopolymer transport system component